jgi:hypothetical protein
MEGILYLVEGLAGGSGYLEVIPAIKLPEGPDFELFIAG